jgi:GNAT superfamily N-acetyltransferase
LYVPVALNSKMGLPVNEKDSSGSVRSESWFSRGVSRVRYLGIWTIPRLVVYRLLSWSISYRSIRCVWVDLRNWRDQSGNKLVPFEIRCLEPEELTTQERINELDLDPADVERAISGGVEACAALDKGSIVSFVWISPNAPSLNGDLALKCDERLAYFYRAFTVPEFRGRGVMPAVLRVALKECAARGDRGVIACIDVANRPSWRAFRSAGFKTIATIRFARAFGRYWIRPRCSKTSPRFQVFPVKSD